MQPWQEVANVAESSHSTPSPLTQIDDLFFCVNELFQQSNNSMSSLEEQMIIPVNMCGDDYWLDQYFEQCEGIANNVDNDTNMEYPLYLFESMLEGTLESHANMSASTSGSNLPAFLENSANTLPTSFIHPSPVFSDASSFPANQPHIHNDLLDRHINCEQITSLGASFSHIPAYGNTQTTYSDFSASATATSDDNLFDSAASSYQLNTAMGRSSPSPLNLEVPASQLQLNLEAGASLFHQHLEAGASLFHQHLQASNHGNRETRDSATPKIQDSVSFLVENAKPTIDDGYVWRKYGQKSIKHKIHPRAYFRCARPNCPIKKQTESSSDTQGCVLITYIGKHNHSV